MTKQNKEQCVGDAAWCFPFSSRRWCHFCLFFLNLSAALDFPLRAQGRDEGQHFLPLSFLSPLKKANSVYFFHCSEESAFFFAKPSSFMRMLVLLNSTVWPVFWQLSYPHFLVIFSFLESLSAYSWRSMWSAGLQEVPIYNCLSDMGPCHSRCLSIHFLFILPNLSPKSTRLNLCVPLPPFLLSDGVVL